MTRTVVRRDRRASAARLLHGAAATLAAGVVADSTAEHYRAGFHNPVMFVAPVVSSATLATALSAGVARDGQRGLRQAVFVGAVATGLVGLAFHLKNVSQRAGGWNTSNVFYGAPLAAPLAVTMAGVLGLAAVRIGNDRSSASLLAAPIGVLSALGLIGTSTEAAALHFRGAFQNPFMYAPVALPPLTAVTLTTASLIDSTVARAAAARFLRATWWLGIIGVGFHAWGVHRRMGGWRNWRQNLLAGPPLPAPPAFTGLALAGLASLDLLKGDRAR